MSVTDLELIISLGLFLLGLNIFHDHFVRHVTRTCHKIPPTPDMTTPVFLPYVRKLHQHLPRCLPLDILHQLTCRKTRRCRHKQVHMIPRNMPFQDLYLIGQTDLPDQLPHTNRNLLCQNRSPILRDPDKMQLDIVAAMRRGSIKLHAAIILK